MFSLESHSALPGEEVLMAITVMILPSVVKHVLDLDPDIWHVEVDVVVTLVPWHITVLIIAQVKIGVLEKKLSTSMYTLVHL